MEYTGFQVHPEMHRFPTAVEPGKYEVHLPLESVLNEVEFLTTLSDDQVITPIVLVGTIVLAFPLDNLIPDMHWIRCQEHTCDSSQFGLSYRVPEKGLGFWYVTTVSQRYIGGTYKIWNTWCKKIG